VDGTVVSQPQRKLSSAEVSAEAKALVARRSMGAAAARPSVISVAKP
jgi:hypothetical protein